MDLLENLPQEPPGMRFRLLRHRFRGTRGHQSAAVGHPRASPGSQHRFRGQPEKAAQGKARPEPTHGLLVITHLFPLFFGNPHHIIVSQQRNPVGAGGGNARGKQPCRLGGELGAADDDAVLGIEPHGARVKVEGAHKNRLAILDEGLGVQGSPGQAAELEGRAADLDEGGAALDEGAAALNEGVDRI